jgi:hypothetical protein
VEACNRSVSRMKGCFLFFSFFLFSFFFLLLRLTRVHRLQWSVGGVCGVGEGSREGRVAAHRRRRHRHRGGVRLPLPQAEEGGDGRDFRLQVLLEVLEGDEVDVGLVPAGPELGHVLPVVPAPDGVDCPERALCEIVHALEPGRGKGRIWELGGEEAEEGDESAHGVTDGHEVLATLLDRAKARVGLEQPRRRHLVRRQVLVDLHNKCEQGEKKETD